MSWSAPENGGRPALTGYDLQYREAGAAGWEDGPQGVPGLSATITRLAPGTAYQVQVRAVNADGDGEWSDAGAGSTRGPPVFADAVATRSMAETVGGSETASRPVGAPVSATDDDPGDTLAYSLEGADAAAFAIDAASGQISTRTDRVYSFEEQSGHLVTVRASDGTESASVAVTIEVTDVNEPPLVPGAPAAMNATTTELTVGWTAPEDNAGRPAITGYDLQYREAGAGTWEAGPQGVTGTSATIASLAPGTVYAVQVRAVNDEGAGPWSGAGEGSTDSAGNAAPVFANAAETRRIAETVGTLRDATPRPVGMPVVATDDDPGDSLAYSLEGADAAAFAIDAATGQISTRTGPVYSFELNPRYSVTVRATDGVASATVAVAIEVTDENEPPLKVARPDVRAATEQATEQTVSWAPPENRFRPALTGYDLRYRAQGAGTWEAGPQGVTGTSATITRLAPGTVYAVQVRAANDEGVGAVVRCGAYQRRHDPHDPGGGHLHARAQVGPVRAGGGHLRGGRDDPVRGDVQCGGGCGGDARVSVPDGG